MDLAPQKNISDGNGEVDRKLEMPLRQKTITFPKKSEILKLCGIFRSTFFVGCPPSSTKVSWFGWSGWWNQWYFRWSHLDGCLRGENPSRSLCALDVCGVKPGEQRKFCYKNHLVEDKDRSNSGGLGNVVPGLVLSDSLTCWKLLSGIDTLDLLNATIPPVFIAWFDISKENSMIFTLEEGLTVLRSTFTVYVNEFIPLLHAKLSYQYFPSLVKHIEIRVRRIGISCDWTAVKSLRNDHVNGMKRIIPEHRTIVAQALETISLVIESHSHHSFFGCRHCYR